MKRFGLVGMMFAAVCAAGLVFGCSKGAAGNAAGVDRAAAPERPAAGKGTSGDGTTDVKTAAAGERLAGSIQISGAFALYPLVTEWAQEFEALHPAVRIDVSAGGAGKGIADALNGIVDFGMVSRELAPAELDRGARPYAVARDAVLVIINAKAPFAAAVRSNGMSKQALADVFITGTSKLGAHVYTRADSAGAADVLAWYLGAKGQGDLVGTGIAGDPALVDAVRTDTLGIGYGNLNFVYDGSTGKPFEGIAVVPLDINADGTLGADERFYDTRQEIDNAIESGRYPSPPARDLYLVGRGAEPGGVAKEFLLWVLTDGQASLSKAGYTAVAAEKIAAELASLPK